MFPSPITAEQFAKARMIADPINLLDSSGIGDGAAAVVLCPTLMAQEYRSEGAVRIRASAMATDAVAVHDRRDPLLLAAAQASAVKAYPQAGVGPQDIDLFELHDAFTIMSALSLEAAGFAPRGKGVWLAPATARSRARAASPSAPWAASRRAAIPSAPPASIRSSRSSSSCVARPGPTRSQAPAWAWPRTLAAAAPP